VTSNESRAQSSLARSISTSLGKVALVIVTIQSIVVFGINYFDYHNLYLAHVELETQSLLDGVKTGSGELHFTLPHEASRYNGKHQDAYGFRVLDATGRVIAAKGPAILEAVSPWRRGSAVATDFWFMKLDGSRPFYFAGGRKLRVDDHDVLIEIVTLGDPAYTRWWLTLSEAVEDVWLPIAPLLILIPIMTTIAVRRGLRPLVRAAQQAQAIHVGQPTQRLDLADMPRETVAFASAINGLIERVANLVQSQKIFIASAAHELRTPLAIMLLELEKINHPRARRLNADVTGMTRSVNRLLVLAGLEATQPPELVDVDLGDLAKDTIDRLQPLADAQGHKIDLCLGGRKNCEAIQSPSVRPCGISWKTQSNIHPRVLRSALQSVRKLQSRSRIAGQGLPSKSRTNRLSRFEKVILQQKARDSASPLCGRRLRYIAAPSKSVVRPLAERCSSCALLKGAKPALRTFTKGGRIGNRTHIAQGRAQHSAGDERRPH
jgi:two-component system, OmpR family, sensor histidine kinase QseC